MIQPIYLYGSEVLRKKAPQADITEKEYLASLVQDLKDTLEKADGCGLAAPQIGVSLRVLIVDGRELRGHCVLRGRDTWDGFVFRDVRRQDQRQGC